MKLFLKGDRCYSDKCSVDRRSYAPGQHGQRRSKISPFAIQLREKQKVKRMYGVLEKQFRGYFEKADRMKGITGENLLILLERRLDNMVYRCGFANSRNEARMLVRQNHFVVNKRKVNIPSFSTKPGDIIEVKEKSRKVTRIQEAMGSVARREIPSWLELDKNRFAGTIKGLPIREELTMPIQEQLIVELYSK
jgi:small subunit ribosomal protein S4